MTTKIRIEQGASCPYHGETPIDWAELAAVSVLADLGDRRGIKWGLQGIDDDVRVEIVGSLAAIIRECNPSDVVKEIERQRQQILADVRERLEGFLEVIVRAEGGNGR